ncbi:hypothetical protein A2767_01435 [Candidatus Roizmanbacteria bacterium RIFCSPHIGHO2_01_FULL_35_10]|uniref:Isochorismatase-like domain-containing protein n=1 Tax=Candidatus Roizmanbacteria bacterium RIFCSPLOWO2_01_FULL_35_13 TaxID=1802055 RepID=A0A1F7IAW6_9BACT|nr:MAG: hypothetical protein A2767_01435 [Candidatus Roizmanbacteria bacterium RIFCSPHIGHO2_01_FULL_35_10]OGK40499.1 MAG: hypothetical protein A3A74_02800 [Candidatus Roizmanbacteria bacterium RIFCSPLOWO2_01_FULL_35_13]
MQSNKALLITDMIDVYIYGEKPLVPLESREKLILNIKKAINLARKKNIPIIYVNSAFRTTDPIYKLINYREQATEKLNESKVINDLKPTSKDLIVKKRGFDGFWQSNLDHLLKKMGITEIFLVGCQTDCCIRETAITGSQLGYDVFVLEDCCQTSREFGQIAALRFFSICTKDVINLAELQKKYFI